MKIAPWGYMDNSIPSAAPLIPGPNFPSLLPASQSPELEQLSLGRAQPINADSWPPLSVVSQTLGDSADPRTRGGFGYVKG